MVDCVWNVMAHAQKPDFVFRRNGRVHLNRRGRQFSRLLAAEVCASAVVMLDTPCSEVVWRVLTTHSIRQFPRHFPFLASPCAITFQLDSTYLLYGIRNGRKVSESFRHNNRRPDRKVNLLPSRNVAGVSDFAVQFFFGGGQLKIACRPHSCSKTDGCWCTKIIICLQVQSLLSLLKHCFPIWRWKKKFLCGTACSVTRNY